MMLRYAASILLAQFVSTTVFAIPNTADTANDEPRSVIARASEILAQHDAHPELFEKRCDIPNNEGTCGDVFECVNPLGTTVATFISEMRLQVVESVVLDLGAGAMPYSMVYVDSARIGIADSIGFKEIIYHGLDPLALPALRAQAREGVKTRQVLLQYRYAVVTEQLITCIRQKAN